MTGTQGQESMLSFLFSHPFVVHDDKDYYHTLNMVIKVRGL
jgi:hypothetical protein